MSMARELGQSEASAKALNAYLLACEDTSTARSEIASLNRRLREARKTLNDALTSEANAERYYLDTPYSHEPGN